MDGPQENLTSSLSRCSPFTGNVSIRGRILSGKVIKTKMNRTLIIRREYLHYVQKYSRYEKRSVTAVHRNARSLVDVLFTVHRHKNMAVHCSPAFRAEVGDLVTVGQCRPLSKS